MTLPEDPFAPPSAEAERAGGDAATARLARFVEDAPPSADYGAMLAEVTAAAAPTRDQVVQGALDDLRDRFSGPYVVDGERVTAPPMFRMNHPRPAAIERAVIQAATKAHVANPLPTKWGQGTPADLVKLTQALIDMGRLPEGPGDVATRIRQMQWEHGLGVDCGGYCREALLATVKRPRLNGPGNESFRDLDRARAGSFAKQPIAEIRPGDLITLDPIAPEVWGHNVVVYRHDVADDAAKRTLSALHGDDVRTFLASPGPHHVIEVDSSWGAGPTGADYGGFRRDTWMYDASTGTWGSFEPWSPRRFVTSTEGPSGDRYHGAYRAR
ncbi:MAG: hypothetical protein JST00_08955 [Deltaproteobacteria bacterium]|nr:hypothetical protein [Deltaproteobacteria bacterium]